MNRLTSLVTSLALLLGASAARGNGRFPAASHVVLGEGPSARVIVLRATFGLLLSDDDGATFRWVCEERAVWPVVPETGYDPPVEVHRDGATLVGSPRGLNRLPTACALESSLTLRGREVVDLATDRTRATVFALTRDASGDRVMRSDDGGASFARVGDARPDADLTTLDVAPSNPDRLYAAGRFRDSARARFDRSDDGGRSWTTSAPAPDGLSELWLSGVSRTDPDTVFVRAPRGLGTALLRSRDGGRSFTEVAATEGPMLGFALADDGTTVWYGSATGGLWRSLDGGARFERIADTPVLCLRAQGPWLYVCSAWATVGWALARSADQGRTLVPILDFSALTGPAACPPSEPQTACEDRWRSLAPQLASVTADAGVRALDAGHAVPRPPTPSGGCACAPAAGARVSALAVLALLVTRRRRPRSCHPRASRFARG
ncbi:MAG: sialidase family protein [Polyangiales bacterium]